jgi:transcriptional regulator with PAS, ATPase and Fis domain
MEREKSECLNMLKDMFGPYGFTPILTWALRFFLRNPYESLVIVDKAGKLRFMDRGSEKFFGLSEGGGTGSDITDFVPDSDIPKTLETGYPLIGRVLNLNGVRKISSVYPLMKDGEVIGAVGRVLFHSLDEINRINRKMDRLKREVKSLRESQRHKHVALYTIKDILGASAAIKEAIDMAKKIAMIDTDVLIIGESGTGKELFVQAIHNFVNPERPFVRVNSPAIPFELAESELFGYEKGAFSGADATGKPGKFELANNGTIYLDEVLSLPLSIQAKLLRVLQEREVERLGGTQIKKVHFRMVTSSSEDLKRAVAEGKFREDLYYRIAKATIYIPPLRERKEDIPVYVNYFLDAINKQFGTHFKGFSDEALDCLATYGWPGNVRELINVLEQAVLKKWKGKQIPLDCLPVELIEPSSSKSSFPSNAFKKEMKETEKELILKALEKAKGNKRRAAALLGISRSTLYNKMEKLKSRSILH